MTEGQHNDAPVIVEVFDEDGENHMALLTTVDFEYRCADTPALFLAGRIEEGEQEDHVDTYVWKHHAAIDKTVSAYAQWVLHFFRLPAAQQHAWKEFFGDKKLFCTYKGKRYRCTGASRYGDVWLNEDLKADAGYQLRVNVFDCESWGPSS